MKERRGLLQSPCFYVRASDKCDLGKYSEEAREESIESFGVEVGKHTSFFNMERA
jgi:hypothetical protein